MYGIVDDPVILSHFPCCQNYGNRQRVQTSRPVYKAVASIISSLALLQVFGIIGNPVAHSRSPVLHNACFAAAGIDAVYIPYLVDELGPFLDAFGEPEFAGFSITIPHKVSHLCIWDMASSFKARG